MRTFPLSFLLTPMLLLMLWSLMSCNRSDEPVVPRYDTTYVTRPDTTYRVVYDTTVTPGFHVDTLGHDTLVRDTLITLDNNRLIVGYCYSGFSTVPDAFLNTHICYSFAKLTMSADSVYLGFTVQNKDRMFARVVALKKKNPNLKIQLSFSNSAEGGGFSRMTSVPAYRKQFAKDCRKFCEDEGIDGVDLDWEWPGMNYNSSYLSDPIHDVDNYTALFKDIREEFGSDFLLTCAGPPQQKEKYKGGYRYMDIVAVEPYLDWMNWMCYDYASAPNPHNAWKCTSAYWDIMRTYQQFKLYGFPMEKSVLGIAFYGRHEFDNDKEWMYKEINDVLLKSFSSTYRRQYNVTWKVPVLYKNNQVWCSYDDTVSIADKAEWALGRGMRGLMYWEVEGDNARKDLQRACYKAMKQQMLHDTTYVPILDSIPVIDTIVSPRLDTMITQRIDTIITPHKQ